jgi:hypothetical protein
MYFQMDWKSTAVISGAGILATWFFSLPASHSPATGATTPAAHAPQAAASTIDIQREAARLQVRVHPEQSYVGSSRNPFRFGARPAQGARPVGTSAPAQPAPVVPQAPPPPRITLDGIATDMVGDQPQRTAILKTDSGVVLAREGDQVAGQFRVTKIAADAVELVQISDGSVLRLALR